jgi:hypothetical protein
MSLDRSLCAWSRETCASCRTFRRHWRAAPCPCAWRACCCPKPRCRSRSGLVEHVGRQGDDRVQQSFSMIRCRMFDSSATALVNTGEPLSSMARRLPPSPFLRGFIFEIRCNRNSSNPSETRRRPGPNRPVQPRCSFSSVTARLCGNWPFGARPSPGAALPLLAVPVEEIRVVDRPRIDGDVGPTGQDAGDRDLQLLAGARVRDSGCGDDFVGHMPR